MKNYTITVNGNVYNVTVEEGTTAGAAPTVSAAKAAPAPKAAPDGTDRSSSIFLYVTCADHPAAGHEASDYRKRA